jgi:acyl carrier protein
VISWALTSTNCPATCISRDLPDISSMKVLQIILETEKFFDIEVSDDLTFRVQTIGKYYDEVDKLLVGHVTASAQA